MISLEQAKNLVELLESEQQEEADQLIRSLQEPTPSPVFQEIGELTRDLHESIKHFSVDDRINAIANAEIPDAKDRLQYVIDKTETAANKTMDAVDRCMPIADNLHEGLLKVRPKWNELCMAALSLQNLRLFAIVLISYLVKLKETVLS